MEKRKGKKISLVRSEKCNITVLVKCDTTLKIVFLKIVSENEKMKKTNAALLCLMMPQTP